jgi:hypothetical protein
MVEVVVGRPREILGCRRPHRKHDRSLYLGGYEFSTIKLKFLCQNFNLLCYVCHFNTYYLKIKFKSLLNNQFNLLEFVFANRGVSEKTRSRQKTINHGCRWSIYSVANTTKSMSNSSSNQKRTARCSGNQYRVIHLLPPHSGANGLFRWTKLEKRRSKFRCFLCTVL